MRTFSRGERVVVKSRPEADYTWTAAWGQKGTVTNEEGTHGHVYVEFDGFAGSKGGWFHPEELEELDVLDKLVEEIGD